MEVRSAAVYWNFRNKKFQRHRNPNGDSQGRHLRGGLLDLSHDGGKTRRERCETGPKQVRQHAQNFFEGQQAEPKRSCLYARIS